MPATPAANAPSRISKNWSSLCRESSIPAATVDNLSTVNAMTDTAGDVTDEAEDSIDILVDIDLAIVKTFAPSSVPQGTIQTFIIEVSNAGPSDAVNVAVDDTVDCWTALNERHESGFNGKKTAPILRDAALVMAIKRLATVILQRDIWP